MVKENQNNSTIPSYQDSSNVLNVVFVSTFWYRNLLIELAKHYGQEQNYCFICSCPYPNINYEIHEKLFHLIQSNRKFRLIYLLEEPEVTNEKLREEDVAQKLSLFNQNNQHFPINRLFIKDLDGLNANELNNLCFYSNRSNSNSSIRKYDGFENIDDIRHYPNAIRFWAPFNQKIQSLPCLINNNIGLETNHAPIYIILVDGYEASYYWTQLYEEFGSPNQYLFIPGMGVKCHNDHRSFNETLGLLEKLVPQNNLKVYGLFSVHNENQFSNYNTEYFNLLKGFNNKGRRCKLTRVYSYKSLNLNPTIFAFKESFISSKLCSFPNLESLYLASHWTCPLESLIDCLNAKNHDYIGTNFPYDEAQSQAMRNYIWNMFVDLIEQRKVLKY